MKNRMFAILLFMLVILISGYFLACEKESMKGTPIKNSSEILKKYNLLIPPYEVKGSLQVGNVKMSVLKNEIYISLDIPGNEMTTNYLVQIDQISPDITSLDLGKSEVIYLKSGLIINSLAFADRLYKFHLSHFDPAYLNGLELNYDVPGYGISERKAKRGFDFRAAPTCKCVAASQDTECASGGFGSLSCSTSNSEGSCSVSCDGGGILHPNMACCNN